MIKKINSIKLHDDAIMLSYTDETHYAGECVIIINRRSSLEERIQESVTVFKEYQLYVLNAINDKLTKDATSQFKKLLTVDFNARFYDFNYSRKPKQKQKPKPKKIENTYIMKECIADLDEQLVDFNSAEPCDFSRRLPVQETVTVDCVKDFTKPVETGKNKPLEDVCDFVPKMVNAVQNYDAVKDLLGEIWWLIFEKECVLCYKLDENRDKTYVHGNNQAYFYLHNEKIKFIEKCVKEWREKVEHKNN